MRAHVRKHKSGASVENAVETKGVGVIRRKRTGMSQLGLFVGARAPLDSNPLRPKTRAFVAAAHKADDTKLLLLLQLPAEPFEIRAFLGDWVSWSE